MYIRFKLDKEMQKLYAELKSMTTHKITYLCADLLKEAIKEKIKELKKES